MYNKEIQVEKVDMGGDESFRYSHDSFGMVKISHIHGNCKTLGSEVESTSAVELTISGCQVTQNLGQDWYSDRGVKAKVRLSAVQYAELISNPNTQGTPCTILYTEKLGRIEQKYIESRTQHIESKVEETVTELQKKLLVQSKKLDTMLSKKGNLTKADRAEISNLFSSSERDITDKLPFYQEVMKEGFEKLKSEARADFNTHIQHAINKTGIAVLNDPNLVNRLLEKK